MEAKDTVMNEEQVRANCYWALKEWEIREGGLTTVRMNLEAQAEISFKAGIKEVVDWIKTERKSKYINDVTYYPVYGKALESQLKEWGIKEEQ